MSSGTCWFGVRMTSSSVRIAVSRIATIAKARVWAVAWLGIWIGAWGIAGSVSGVSPDFLPSPEHVVRKLIWMADASNRVGEGVLWTHIGWSVLRFTSGFLCAAAVGVPLGLVMGQSRLAGDLLSPLFNALRSVPPIAWAPFSLLWFGASFGSQVFVIFVAALPPILANSFRGIRLVDSALVDAARMLGAKPATVLFRVGLRAALPHVLAGARIGITNGWLALIGAEIIAGPGALTGLGFLVLVGQQNLQAAFSIGAMVIIGILGALLDHVMVRIERRFA